RVAAEALPHREALNHPGQSRRYMNHLPIPGLLARLPGCIGQLSRSLQTDKERFSNDTFDKLQLYKCEFENLCNLTMQLEKHPNSVSILWKKSGKSTGSNIFNHFYVRLRKGYGIRSASRKGHSGCRFVFDL